MNGLQDKDLAPLFRKFDPSKFSEKVHGPGSIVVFNNKTGAVGPAPGRLQIWLGRDKNLTYYYLKPAVKPLVIKDVSFRWHEGTSDISLDFKATFELSLDGVDDENLLVQRLHHSDGPASALYTLIDKYLHTCMKKKYGESAGAANNLLNVFSNKDAAVGTSDDLDNKVSEAVCNELNLPATSFRIGFRLDTVLPRRVEIERPTEFTLSDDSVVKVKTSASLELDNYQGFKRSGLKNDEEVKENVYNSIDEAVKKHLFGLQFFTLIEKFQAHDALNEKETLRFKIEEDIRESVKRIGYDAKLVQTLPDVPPLQLIEWTRVNLPPSAEYEFKTFHSTGSVRLDLALEVKIDDFSKLSHWLSPTDKDVIGTLQKVVAQICRDEIHAIARKDFNLEFQRVRNTLETKLKDDLDERYGLNLKVINIVQTQTEDAERFDALLRKATDFILDISPQRDMGLGDKLTYTGSFEVLSIAEEGYDAFESKDYGFRRDSFGRNPSSMRDELAKFDGSSDSEREREWKNICIQRELKEIRKRITSTLAEYFSKKSNIADITRLSDKSKEFIAAANKIAQIAIADEFGLEIKLRGLQRQDSSSDEEGGKGQEHRRELRQDLRNFERVELGEQFKNREKKIIMEHELDPEQLSLEEQIRKEHNGHAEEAKRRLDQAENMGSGSLLEDSSKKDEKD